MDDLVVKELLDVIRQKDAHTAEMIKVMAASQAAQTEVLRTWMELFKPPAQPLSSSTPDTRAALGELADNDKTEWVPMTPQEVAQALALEMN